jgi:CHAD domain-containing protein
MSEAEATSTDQPAPDTTPEMTYRDAMVGLIAERWGDVWKAVPVALRGEDPEGVHDVRVASRRLRAAMDVAVDCFPRSWYRPLHQTAKEITSALGEVRDRDVLLEALAEERAQAPAPERPGIDRLINRIERERVAARVEMEAFLTELLVGDVPRAVVRRFGPAAGPAVAVATNGERNGRQDS